MRKQYPVIGICLASTLFLALQARAQEAGTIAPAAEAVQQEAAADVATVNAQQEATQADTATSALPDSMASGDVMQMDAITVTATRQEEKILNVPQTINVITRQTMDDHNVNNVEEMLRHTPGVHATRQISAGNSVFGGIGSISMRGVGGNRILTVVDGDRVIEASEMTGDVGNRMFVDTQMLKSAEIARGPASTLWGADAMGGMVAYQTIDPDDLLKGREFGGKASIGWDGLNYGKSEHGSMAFQFRDDLQALIGYTHRTHDETRLRKARNVNCGREGFSCGKMLPSHTEIHNALGKVVYRPNQDHQFKLTGEFFESNTHTHLPFSTQAMMGMGGKSFLEGYDYRGQDQKRSRLAFEHKWDVNTNWLDSLKWRVSYSDQERDVFRDSYNTVSATMPSGITIPYRTDQKRMTRYGQDMYQADIQFISSFDAWNTSHKLTYGFQGDLTETTIDVKDVRSRHTGTPTVTKNANTATFADADTTRADLYIQDEIKLFEDRLTLTPGIRRAHYSLDPTGDYDKLSETRWLPQVGAIFKLDDTYSIYGRYAKGFKMPTAPQLFFSYDMGTTSIVPNPDLKPESSNSYELGFRGKYDKAWFSIGAFYTRYKNFISTLEEIAENTYSSINLDRMKIYGLEASGEWQFAQNWSLNGSIDWQYAKYKDQQGNDVPWNVPPLTAMAGLKWKLPEYRVTTELFGTFARATHRDLKTYNETTEEYDDRFKPGGYAVFDGYVNWQMTKNLKLTASVTNILNKRYFDYTAGGLDASNKTNPINPLELYTAPGRTFAVSLQASF